MSFLVSVLRRLVISKESEYNLNIFIVDLSSEMGPNARNGERLHNRLPFYDLKVSLM